MSSPTGDYTAAQSREEQEQQRPLFKVVTIPLLPPHQAIRGAPALARDTFSLLHTTHSLSIRNPPSRIAPFSNISQQRKPLHAGGGKPFHEREGGRQREEAASSITHSSDQPSLPLSLPIQMDFEPSTHGPVACRMETIAIKKLRLKIRVAKMQNGKTQKAAIAAAVDLQPIDGLRAQVYEEIDAIGAMEAELAILEEDHAIARGGVPVTEGWLRRNNCSDGERACFGFGPAAPHQL